MKVFSIKDIEDSSFDLRDLDGKTLRIIRSLDQNIEIISGMDVETEEVYVLYIKQKPEIRY
jgi:hypothetical protein